MEQIRSVAASDFPDILALNDAEVRQTSPMDLERLQALVAMSTHCRVAVIDGQLAAFIIVLPDGSPYDSDNFRWFASRFRRFLYVDRIVVSPQFSGRRIGSRLYEDLFAYARAQGIGTITCEYNIHPPNPASRAFHAKFGFGEVGTQWLAGGSKQVSLQAVRVDDFP